MNSTNDLAFYDLVLKNANACLPIDKTSNTLQSRIVDIGILKGEIALISAAHTLKGESTIDCTGLNVLPGIIDSQVHFREPGLTHKEDIESGTRGAVLGGVTCVFEMPNTKPATTNLAALEEKLTRAKQTAWCDIGFFIGASPESIPNLATLEKHPNCVGVKIFMGSSTGSLLVSEDEALALALASGTRRVAIHSEDEARLIERKSLLDGKSDVALHPVWRDEETALRATKRIVALARKAKRPIHVLHITTAEEVAFLKDQRDIATAEVTPQHLTLSAPDCYERLGTLAQMNPPIRDERHREALWRGIDDGTLSVIGSDHAPHTLEEKQGIYPATPSGMTGVQTLVPIMLNHISEGRLTIEKFCELAALNPAKIYGAAKKGKIAVGMDADFTLVDMNKSAVIENEWIASKSAWTPFAGKTVKGWPVGTIVRGQVVMRDGKLAPKPSDKPFGKPVNFS
jgi:dihydroorotase